MSPQPPSGKNPMNEEEVVRLIASLAGEVEDELAVGIGDDCAVLRLGDSQWCVTTDLLVQGVHFDLSFISPYDLGRRAMAANLSDLAAMGARPRWGFLSLGMGDGPDPEFVEGLIRGVSDLGQEYGLSLAGGDTVRSPAVLLNLCLMGSMESAHPTLRNGAVVGDAVCVTGSLGGSAAGLAWLQSGGDPGESWAASSLEAHLRPKPRVEAGRALTQSGKIHAMMDISDGLATDLARLCAASQVGALVEAKRVPVQAGAMEIASRLSADALDWALTGGEDFELLFTCEPGMVDLLADLAAEAEPGLKVTRLGKITKGRGVMLKDSHGKEREISFTGFDHFRQQG